MRKCTECGVFKSEDNFSKKPQAKKGIYLRCKKCLSDYKRNYSKTINGLIIGIYGSQRRSSRTRGVEYPNYSKKDLHEFILAQDNFMNLYESWIDSGYDKLLTPSIDRKDDYKPYTMDNIQLTTWGENKRRADRDRRNGINNKASKEVSQLDKNGNFIRDYKSSYIANRELNINPSNIRSCCRGERKTAGGFIWIYKKCK